MKEQFIPYDLAVKMRDLGFDETTLTYYTKFSEDNTQLVTYSSATVNELFKEEPDTYIKAPLWQQAFDWFREEYNLHSVIDHKNGFYSFEIDSYNAPSVRKYISNSDVKQYKEARLACLEKLIEIVEQEKLK